MVKIAQETRIHEINDDLEMPQMIRPPFFIQCGNSEEDSEKQI